MQAKHRNFYDDFGGRISFIREKRGLTLGQLAAGAASTAKSWTEGSLPAHDKWESIAKRLNLSVSFVFLGKPTTRDDFDSVAKFTDEIGPPPADWTVHEPPSDYRKPGSSNPSTSGSRAAHSATMLDARFQPRNEPTPQMCSEYFAEYMRRAASEPGAVGYVWVKLRKEFPLEDFEPKNEPAPP